MTCPTCGQRLKLKLRPRARSRTKDGVPEEVASRAESVGSNPAGKTEQATTLVTHAEDPHAETALVEPARASSEPVTHPPIPEKYRSAPKLADYLLIAELGRGGMGKVYKAYHVPSGEIRAVKVLIGEAARSRKVRTRFQREAEVARSINHPHIVRVYEFERDPVRKVYFMAMEYMSGGSLSAMVREQGRLHWTYVLRVAKQVCEALNALHARGLVHRDVKPSNLLLDSSGNVKLADMGLIRYESEGDESSQLTATGAVMGTLDYMAPEQIVDPRNTDIRSDLYALGCTLFHLLTGRPPFPEGSAYQKIQQHLSHPLPEIGLLAPDVPSPFVLIINRLTAKDPSERFQNPSQLMDALRNLEKELLAGGSDPTASGLEIPEDFRRAVENAAAGTSSLDHAVVRRRRQNWLFPALIAAGVLAVALLGWLLVRGTSGGSQPETGTTQVEHAGPAHSRQLPDINLPE